MIFGQFERMVALRYLRPRRSEGFVSLTAAISICGIALGVATLIIVMSVMNGFRHELLGQILGLNGHLSLYANAGYLTDYDPMAAKLRGLPDITAAAPIVEGQALVTQNGVAGGAMVRGFEPADLKAKQLIATHIDAGSLDRFADDGIAIGSHLAERFGVHPGERLTLVSPQGKDTPFGTIPRTRAFTVAAVFDTGMFQYDSGFIFMPLPAAQQFFGMDGKATAIEIMITDPDRGIPSGKKVVRSVYPGARLVDWQQSNGSFFGALNTERNVMFVILMLIIAVAALNIISSMVMLVKDKTRDIAILRTMGATRGTILRIFFMTGTSIGVAGTIAGLALGVAFATNIETIRRWLEHLTGTNLFAPEVYFLSQLPAIVQWPEVALIVGLSLALTFLATIFPALRAARLEPVEALRYE